MADDKRPGWGALLPRFNIPETFGTALSYEGQLHWFLENWDQVAEYANNLEQPTVTVGKTEFPDTSNALLPSITNSGTDINAVLDFTYPVIRTRFADPLQWDFETSYDVLTVVSDGQGNSYTSRQAVPAHTAIENTDYWARTGNYDASLEYTYQLIDAVEREYSRVYETTADMQADEKLVPGMVCRTLGFYTVGDGGGAWYVIGEDAEDGHAVLGLATNDTASVIINGTASPEMFGAVGDGVNDDTAAFVAMFAMCRDVTLKAGANYLVNNAGQARTFILKDGANINFNGATLNSNYVYTFRNYDVTTDTDVMGYDGNGGISIYGGTLVHGCLTLAHADGVSVHDMTFEDAAGIHVLQLGGCRNVNIYNCAFLGMRDGLSGTYETINIECMDYTGQPYYTDHNAPTYDLTPSRDITVSSCVFAPGGSGYDRCGDGVGTHYAPIVDGNVACDYFQNINVINCDITAISPDVYSIRCNNWKDSTIQGNIIRSSQGVQVAVAGYPCDGVRIIANRHISAGTGKLARILSFKSGQVNNMTVVGNTYRQGGEKMAYFNAMDGLEQGAVNFSAVDGLYLINTSGEIAQNDTVYNLNTALDFSNFIKLEVICGVVSSGTFCAVPIYAYPGQRINVGGALKGYMTIGDGRINTVTVVDAHTLMSDTLYIRSVIAYL